MNRILSNVFERQYFKDVSKTRFTCSIRPIVLRDHSLNQIINQHETMFDHYSNSRDEEDMIFYNYCASLQEMQRIYAMEVNTIEEESKVFDEINHSLKENMKDTLSRD